MTMKTTFYEFVGIDSWTDEEKKDYINDMWSTIDEQQELIRDLYGQLLNAYDPKELDGFIERMRDLGIEPE